MNKLKLSLITTAFVSCGFTAQALAVEDQTPVVTQSQNVEESYYEDSDDFDVAGSQSNAGWGWSKNVAKDPLGAMGSDSESTSVIIIDDPVDSDPVTLSSVDHIVYTPFTALGNVNVKWAAISSSSSITYTLQSQKDNGSWTTVYTGSATTKAFSGLTDGAYKYRVKGCTSTDCSPYKEYVYMQVKTANNGLLANVTATANKNGVESQNAVGQKLLADFTIPKLGYGYDMVRGEPKSSHCWNVATDSEIVGSTTTAFVHEFAYNIVTSAEELATQLDLETSVELSVEYGAYSAEYRSTKQLLAKTRMTKNSTVIVAKLKETHKQIVAKSEPTLNLTTYALDQLRNNKSNYRNNCGDKYIDRVTMGRFAYVTIKVSAEGKTHEEITKKTEELKVDVGLAEGSYNNSTTQSLTEKYQGYELDIFAVVIGSDAGVVKLTDIAALVGFLGEFESSTDDTLFPVDFSQKFYNIPAEYNTTDHFSVFTDYTLYSQILGAWTRFDRQVAERCYNFDRANPVLNEDDENLTGLFIDDANKSTGLTVDQVCTTSKRIIAYNISNCAAHQTWADCAVPSHTQCTDFLTGTQCMDFPDTLPVWSPDTQTSRLEVRAPGGCWSDKNTSGEIKVCLAPQSVLNYTKQWDVIIQPDDQVAVYSNTTIGGLGTTQTEVHRVRSASHTATVEGDQHCVVSRATAWCDGRWFGGPGGWYKSDQVLHGLVPTMQPYYF
ncbi:MAG: hypothetical protein HRT35_34415 [Algicola sp.]|nr:hypothetical protein [Algicola sp.]